LSQGNICSRCYYDCYTCLNYTKCLTCNSTTDFRVLDNSSNRCVCLSGFYESSSQLCLQCPYNCTACTSPNICQTCNSGYNLTGTLCLSLCPVRKFLGELSSCVPCPYDCYTCDNRSNCLTCNNLTDFRIYNSTSKRCVSIDGYFDNSNTASVLCPTNCSLCQSLTLCLQCSKGYLGPSQLCGDCPLRYFANSQTKACVKCPYDCYTCDANNSCLSCSSSDNRALSNSRCVPVQGYYSDGVNSLCIQCPVTCS